MLENTSPFTRLKPKPTHVREVALELDKLLQQDQPDLEAAHDLMVRLVEILAVYMDHAGNRTGNIHRCVGLYRDIRNKQFFD